MVINVKYVFINKDFFQNNNTLKELIDPITELSKLSGRTYLYITVKIGRNKIYIPLRKHIDIKKYGKIGFSVPSSSRPDAGLDYRKLLIVEDDKYINELTAIRIARSQMNIIANNAGKILLEVKDYIEGYKEEYKNGDIVNSKKYRYSTLVNYHKEIGLE